MTALNFPASPSNGDEFEGYIYDSTLGVWNRKPSTVAYTVSANAPTNPNDGDVWFNEQDGSSYIYYTDSDSEQWVEIGGKVGATGAAGQNGTDGINGTDGVDGVDGVGVIVGGTTGQVLAKASATDYDTEWVDVAVGPQPANTISSDNIALDFSDGVELEQRTVTGDVTFTASNYTSGVKKTIYLEGDTVKRNLTFPTAWNFITDKPTAIGADKKNILDLNSFGTSESTTVAIWLGASAWEPIVATGGSSVYEIEVSGVAYRVHEFLTSASFSVSESGSDGLIEYLIVGGGGGTNSSAGGSGASGGAGGGGVLTSVQTDLSSGLLPASPLQSVSQASYPIVIGQGGVGANNAQGTRGDSSTAFGFTAYGGGGAGQSYTAESDGASGGGEGINASTPSGNPGSSIYSQGFNGGDASGTVAGGGGGAGEPGPVGNGGDGVVSNIRAVPYYFGGGGAGQSSTSVAYTGGQGGGGDSRQNGLANTGGGAGGHGNNNAAYDGGSGIVIVRYPITDPN